jgi:hypothetical protein
LTKACQDAGIIDCAEVWLNAQEGSLHVSEQGETGRGTSIPLSGRNRRTEESRTGERAPDVRASQVAKRP